MAEKTRFLAYCYSSHARSRRTDRVRARSNGEVSISSEVLSAQRSARVAFRLPCKPRPLPSMSGTCLTVLQSKHQLQDSQHFNRMVKVMVRTRNRSTHCSGLSTDRTSALKDPSSKAYTQRRQRVWGLSSQEAAKFRQRGGWAVPVCFWKSLPFPGFPDAWRQV